MPAFIQITGKALNYNKVVLLPLYVGLHLNSLVYWPVSDDLSVQLQMPTSD